MGPIEYALKVFGPFVVSSLLIDLLFPAITGLEIFSIIILFQIANFISGYFRLGLERKSVKDLRGKK